MWILRILELCGAKENIDCPFAEKLGSCKSDKFPFKKMHYASDSGWGCMILVEGA